MDSDEDELDDRFGTCDFDMPASSSLATTADLTNMASLLNDTSSTIAANSDPTLTAQQYAFLDQITKMGLITDDVVDAAQRTNVDDAITEAIEADAKAEAAAGTGAGSDDIIDDDGAGGAELPVDQNAVADLLNRFAAIEALGPQWGAGSSLDIKF
jgi:hypothetical protein